MTVFRQSLVVERGSSSAEEREDGSTAKTPKDAKEKREN
jgi:hypothetical protein